MKWTKWSTSFDLETKTAYAEAGEGDLFLLLHGLFDTSYTWHRLFGELSREAHLVAPDLPGFGRTSLPQDWGESISGMVEHVLRFLDRWKNVVPIVVGSSMGGGLALALASAAPERFKRVVLLNPYAAPSLPLAATIAKNTLIGTLFPCILTRSLRRHAAKRIFSRSLYDQSELTPAYLDELISPWEALSRRRELLLFLKNIDREAIEKLDLSLPSLSQEVLLIWGENDGWLPPHHADRLQRRLRHCLRKNLPLCGHLPHLEQPAQVASVIRQFLNTHSERL